MTLFWMIITIGYVISFKVIRLYFWTAKEQKNIPCLSLIYKKNVKRFSYHRNSWCIYIFLIFPEHRLPCIAFPLWSVNESWRNKWQTMTKCGPSLFFIQFFSFESLAFKTYYLLLELMANIRILTHKNIRKHLLIKIEEDSRNVINSNNWTCN